MTSRVLAWIAGGLMAAALVFTIPTVAAQSGTGACVPGAVCPTGAPLALRSGSDAQMQGRNGGLIGVAADTLDMTRQALLSELNNGL